MAHHNSTEHHITMSFELGEKIVLLFQVSHTRKKVIYFPLKCFCIIFIPLLLPAFIFLNQYNHVHEVLCILCVLCCFASSIYRLISFHLHDVCTKWNDKIVHLYLFRLLFLLDSAHFPNLFHLLLALKWWNCVVWSYYS